MRPVYPGSPISLLGFLSGCILLVTLTVTTLPSFFITSLSLFLTLGFLCKFAAHLGMRAQLIEPVGAFDGSGSAWDTALSFSTAGLLGTCASVFIAARFPVTVRRDAGCRATDARLLFALLFLQLSTSCAVYALNYKMTILRIGYPIGIELAKPIYGVLAFIISWGAVLGALFLTQRLVDIGRLSPPALIYVAGLIGALASFTMGSRVQLLLYVLAAALAVIVQWRSSLAWRAIAVALVCAGGIFMMTLAVVSIQRNLSFHGGGEGSAEPTLTKQRLDGIAYELRTLVVMRWVGLEGVMTTSAEPAALGWPLFAAAMRESPSVGARAIYQHMSGDKYLDVKNFVFLSIPGPISVASLSGSPHFIGAFMFALALSGHLIERAAQIATRSIAACAVVGVSLSYQFAQLNVPWTLFIFVLELLAALAGLAALRRALDSRGAREKGKR